MRDGLLKVRKFVIPARILEETSRFLKQVGEEGVEGFVLWAGTNEGEQTFRFTRAIMPDQRAMVTSDGLLVTVDGYTLFEINRAVHERKEVLAAQVHSHPTDAYHSTTDDTYPLVTLVGALSIVIPDFASNAPKDFRVWAWYRLSRKGRWEPIGPETQVVIE